jgi:N,N'-diacetyllegionaminate synthase
MQGDERALSVFVIAEAGVNHNGSLELAKKLVDAAKDAGADCVKFQTFIAENIVSKHAAKAEYQKTDAKDAESQYDMLKKLELSFHEIRELNEYCAKKDIEFLSTAFDLESVEYLNGLSMKRWKIPSGEITNLPYLLKIARLNKPIILSTGMSTLDEIKNAVTVLKQNGAVDITVLHCTTEYPAPYRDVNLRAMLTIKEALNVKVGYSDHTEGIEVPIAAAALGAVVIEKHFTLDRNMEGPDHSASLEPDEFKSMVNAIRNIETCLGDGIKQPAEAEIKNIPVVRKSIVANRDIKKGEVFSEENLVVKRPGNGISPMRWFDVLGKPAKRDFQEDELIEL